MTSQLLIHANKNCKKIKQGLKIKTVENFEKNCNIGKFVQIDFGASYVYIVNLN